MRLIQIFLKIFKYHPVLAISTFVLGVVYYFAGRALVRKLEDDGKRAQAEAAQVLFIVGGVLAIITILAYFIWFVFTHVPPQSS